MNRKSKLKSSLLLLLWVSALFSSVGCKGEWRAEEWGAEADLPLYTGNGVLSWATPTLYSDGSDLPSDQIEGYRIYVRTSSGRYNPGNHSLVSAPTTSVYLRDYSLPIGDYYFAVTTIDKMRIESAAFSEVGVRLE